MDALGPVLLIFALRICDVSVGTLRVIYMVRGKRLLTSCLAVVECGIWIFAVSKVLNGNPSVELMLGYALGFAAGTAVGITLEQWIASGFVLARIISRDKGELILHTLRQADFGATVVRGQGKEGEHLILFVVMPRRRSKELLRIVREIDPAAFVTTDGVNPAAGGYIMGLANGRVRK